MTVTKGEEGAFNQLLHLIQDLHFSLVSYTIFFVQNLVILYKKYIMVIADAEAEIEAPGTRGNEEAVQLRTNSDGGTGTGRASVKAGSESLPTHRDDRSWGNIFNECGQATLGGIVNQLISKITKEIADAEERIADRQEYLKELKELSKQLRGTSEETI